MFDWNDLRHFLAVARHGSTIQAAKALGINQSTVQRRIGVLERQLGHTLFERRPGGYRLTRLGAELLPIAERVEVDLTDFARQATSSDAELVGTIRVTCPETAGYRMMKSPLLDLFHSRYPRLRVELVMVDRVLDLAKGEADIAFRTNVPQDNALVARKVAEVPWAVFASRSYIERPRLAADTRGHQYTRCDPFRWSHCRPHSGAMDEGHCPKCSYSGTLYQHAGTRSCRKVGSGYLAASNDRRTARTRFGLLV